jgi:hypothetical protein
MRACPVRREERQTTGKRYTWGIARGVTAWMDQHLADDVVARRRQQQVGRRLPGQATARPPRSGDGENDAAVDPFLDALPG